MITSNENLYTVSEVAEKLSITTGRVRQICRAQEIGQMVGTTRILTESDVKQIASRPDNRRSATKSENSKNNA